MGQWYEHKESGQHILLPWDKSVDGSGYSPWVLGELLDLAARMPFGEAAEVAKRWGVEVSRAEMERLSAGYSQRLEQEINQHLEALELEALVESQQSARLMVLEIDGVRVCGQPEPQTHQCEGIEIKAALVYPHHSPSERSRIAGEMNPQQLLPRLSGLLREAGVTSRSRIT